MENHWSVWWHSQSTNHVNYTRSAEVKRDVSESRNETMFFTFRSAEWGERYNEWVQWIDSNALDVCEILPSFFLWREKHISHHISRFTVTLVTWTAFPLMSCMSLRWLRMITVTVTNLNFIVHDLTICDN